MYILINNRPYDVLNLNISDIKKLEHFKVNEYVREYRKYKPDINDFGLCLKENDAALYQFCRDAGWEITEISGEEFEELHDRSNWRETPGVTLFERSKYGELEYIKVKFNPESYYFVISDSKRCQYSKIYNSLEEATEARDQVLKLVNKVYASLKRVEI